MKARNGIGWIAAVILLMATASAYSAELINRQVVDPANLLAAPESNRGMFRLAMFDFIPEIAVGMMYDDNIFATSSNTVEDFIWTIAPGIRAVASDPRDGKIFSLSYIPTFVVYTENPDQSNTGQAASLNARLPLGKLTLGLNGSMNIGQSVAVGTGELVETRTYLGAATAQYDLGAKTSVEVTAVVNTGQGEDLIGNTTWQNEDWINYAYSARLSLGVGVSFNYETIEDSPDQTFERLLLRADYRISERLVLRATAGPEWRQYGGQGPNTLYPYFTIGATYRIAENTTVDMDAVGRVQASLDLTGQNYYSASLRLYVSQRLVEQLFLTVGGGYEHDSYYSVEPGITADQPTDLVTIGGRLSYRIRDNWSAGVFYNYRHDPGNATFNEFTDNQAGIQTSWRY